MYYRQVHETLALLIIPVVINLFNTLARSFQHVVKKGIASMPNRKETPEKAALLVYI